MTIANSPDDRLTIDDCSFGIKGIKLIFFLDFFAILLGLESLSQGKSWQIKRACEESNDEEFNVFRQQSL